MTSKPAGTSPHVVDGSFVPKRHPTVASMELDGEAVLVHGSSTVACSLDAVGAIVWASIDGTSTVDDIVDDLSVEFAANRDIVRHDVVGLIRRLESEGLLQGHTTEADLACSTGQSGVDAAPGPERQAGDRRYLKQPPSS